MKFATRWPPVPARILIGISMLMALIVAGRGIGVSGAMTCFVAWVQHGLFSAATESSSYFGKYLADGTHPLNDYAVFLVAALIVGSFVAAWPSGELKVEVIRGPRSSVAYRLILVLLAGMAPYAVIAGWPTFVGGRLPQQQDYYQQTRRKR
jgi:hypothetical protein